MDAGKRATILAEARHMFTHAGFEATNMDRLAEAAGVSKTTIYKRFQSKEHLLQALLDDLLAQLPAPATLVARGGGPLRPRLLAIGKEVCATATSRLVQDIHELMADAGAANCTVPGAFWECCAAPYRTAFARMLHEHAQRDGLHVPDPDLATSQFFGLVASEPFLRLATGARPLTGAALARHVTGAVDTFLRAFRQADATS